MNTTIVLPCCSSSATMIDSSSTTGTTSPVSLNSIAGLVSAQPWEMERHPWTPERLQNADVQITEDLHLVALAEEEHDAVMLLINHSCEPNVGFGGNIVLVAMRDVAGEELTTYYALFDDYEGSIKCTCGRSTCRGCVDGRDWQPQIFRSATGVLLLVA